VAASATGLPIRNNVFSLVTAFSLIEHIPMADRFTFYEEIKRVIKKEGRLVIQFPNRYAIAESHTYIPLFGFLPSSMHSFAYRNEYVAVPSLKTVLQSLAKHGFHVYRIEKYKAPFLPFDNFLNKIGLFCVFPMGYIVHAQMTETGNPNV
jgi:ubiquinone/menaquinone biosynthesis C-methylase UbiE